MRQPRRFTAIMAGVGLSVAALPVTVVALLAAAASTGLAVVTLDGVTDFMVALAVTSRLTTSAMADISEVF